MSQNPGNKETLQLIWEVARAVLSLANGITPTAVGIVLGVKRSIEEMTENIDESQPHEDAAHGWWQHSLALEAHYEKARSDLIEFYKRKNRISGREMTAKINKVMEYHPPVIEEIPVEPDEEFTRVPDVEGADHDIDRAAISTFD